MKISVTTLLAFAACSMTTVDGLVIDGSTNSTALNTAINGNYDYIVVGAGNAGMAVAARLSDRYQTKVLVLEAGGDTTGNSAVPVPGFAGATFGSAIDWSYNTVPQTSANGQAVFWPRGKGLGGSTLLNFMAWTRGRSGEINDWNALSSFGWTWSSLLPFFKKAEAWIAGTTAQITVFAQPSVHGTTGPVKATYPPYVPPQFKALYSAIQASPFNVPIASDLSSGNPNGVSWAPSSINSSGNTRVDSYTAYGLPRANSNSLTIITNVQVSKVLFSPQTYGGTRCARGVTFTGAAGSFTVNGDNVVLSAGSIGTPQILELSGIGNPSVMNPLGISTVVNLPGVGENLQDHPAVVSVFKLKSQGTESIDLLSQDSNLMNAALTQYGNGQGILTHTLSSLAFIKPQTFLSNSEFNSALVLMANNINSMGTNAASGIAKQIQAFQQNSPLVEIVPINVYFGATAGQPGVKYMSVASCLMQSQSRGSIHITSSNVATGPAIDPRYLSNPTDKYLLARSARFVRSVMQSSPLEPFIDSEAEPGPEVSTDSQFEDWVSQTVRTEYHPVGTAAMLPRNKGGVVNADLKVYGTSNLYVVDLSVVPLHVTAHPQSLAYAIAERAATLI